MAGIVEQGFLCSIVSYEKRQTMSLQKQFLISKQACKVTVCLPKEGAKGAKTVKLVGDFNNWETKKGIPMKHTTGATQR